MQYSVNDTRSYLSNLWIEEGDESKRPERLWNEDIGDLAEGRKILAEVVSGHLLRAAAHKHLAGHLLYLSLLELRPRKLDRAHFPNLAKFRYLDIDFFFFRERTLELGILTSHHLPSIMCL